MLGVWVRGAKEKMIEQINNDSLDVILRYNNLSQDVIVAAAARNKSIKVINLGAGAKRIISNTGVCPVCGSKLKGA